MIMKAQPPEDGQEQKALRDLIALVARERQLPLAQVALAAACVSSEQRSAVLLGCDHQHRRTGK